MSLENGRILKVEMEVPSEDIERLAWYCDENVGVLTWSYEDLKGYNSSIIQYTIEFDDGAKSVWQK